MKVKRIKKLKVNSTVFDVVWDKDHGGGSFQYIKPNITIGLKNRPENEIFMIVCHELMEICATEMSVRFPRPDCESDFIFVYDHRQHDTMMEMFSGLLDQFLK